MCETQKPDETNQDRRRTFAEQVSDAKAREQLAGAMTTDTTTPESRRHASGKSLNDVAAAMERALNETVTTGWIHAYESGRLVHPRPARVAAYNAALERPPRKAGFFVTLWRRFLEETKQ